MSTVGTTAGRRTGVIGVLVLVVVLVVGLLWAKWLPYADKTGVLAHARAWSGSSVFDAAGSSPSFARAWDFTVGYVDAIWRALVVALLVGAAISLVPSTWLLRAVGRGGVLRPGVVGAAASLPSMMCTCCTAPVAVSLRRSGLPLSPTVAYWLGNPMLNPAVLVFLVLVLPWQYAAVRLVVGLAVVLVAAVLVGRVPQPDAAPVEPVSSPTARQLPGRFLRRLALLTLVLVPEYLLVVFVVGLLSGWAADFSGIAQGGILAVLLLVLVGTLLVVPTGGEIPVVVALLAAGVGAGPAGALLLTLPAISLPSAVMVARALSWRAVGVVAAVVAAGGLVGAAALAVVG
ncbi:MAG: permease [Nocardioidaceae bacterium]|nr:permease [Nocardioidaceae bacterium]MCL2614773.1 permease [Nocardioidaceae bacterium]